MIRSTRSGSIAFGTAWAVLSLPAVGQDLDAGLIARYELNGNGQNSVGSFCPGSVVGAVPTADRFGHPGQSLAFDGSGDYVWFGACSLPTEQISVSLWFRTTTQQTGQSNNPVLIRWRTQGLLLYLNSNNPGSLVGVIVAGGSNTGAQHHAPAVNDGAWHHAALVYDGQLLELFLDGQLTDSEPLSGSIIYGAGGLALARDGDRNGAFYEGDLDEVRIYDRGLSDLEVLILAGRLPSDLTGDGCVDLTDLSILLADIGCASDCGGDTDGDDDTDLSDLAILLANYGSGC